MSSGRVATAAVCALCLVVLAEADKCNHTDLVWDSSRSGVGIPSSCTDLSLVEESIGDVGAIALAQHLGGGGGNENTLSGTGESLQLQTLDLYENHIGDEGARALSRALASPSSTLKELYLWGNTIGNAGAQDIAKALEVNTQLEALVMWNNKVGDKGCDALLKALDMNTHVSKLYLTGNKVSAPKLKELKARLTHEEVLKRKAAAAARGTDCVVGEWEAWSECEGACGGDGFQHREREVVTPRAGEHGRRCPPLEEVRPCVTVPCPKDPLTDFMRDCQLSDPVGVAELSKDLLGAAQVQDLFELDADDLKELGLKVAQRKKLIRCVCDASEDGAPCCDAHKGQGRHHSSVEDIMKLAEVVRRGDAMATDGSDCDGALALYGEALEMSKAMAAHNFYGEVSFKVFLVKTRCRGHRTPSRAEAEACAERGGIDFLGQEWLVEDFRRGVQHGWSKAKHAEHEQQQQQQQAKDGDSSSSGEEGKRERSKGLEEEDEEAAVLLAAESSSSSSSPGAERGESEGPGLTSKGAVKGIASPAAGGQDGAGGLGLETGEEEDEPMAGLHWSSWYDLFGTTPKDCTRKDVDRVWGGLMLKYNADQAYRHTWSPECANLASIVVSSGRELLFQMTPCGKRSGSKHEEM